MMNLRKFKKSFLLILILFISIGFAVLTANININSLLSFRQNTFDVHLENPSIYDSTTSLNSTTSLSNTTSLSFSTTYTKPGEAVDVLFYIVNDGTIDAAISSISTTLTTEQSNYISYRFNYATDNSLVSNNDVIYAGQARKVIGHFEYKYDIDDLVDLDHFSTTVTINFVQAPVSNNNVWAYEYVGDYQTFTAPKTGSYKIELWGASGGSVADAYRGLGAYTSGKINLEKGDTLYLYVGKQGITNSNNPCPVTFNGGGYSIGYQYNYVDRRFWSSGGGSTDIRTVSGNWDDFDSLKSRIMVTGAGGGSFGATNDAFNASGLNAGAGGGLYGYDGSWSETNKTWGRYGTGGIQTAGGFSACLAEDNCKYTQGRNYSVGSFGKGGYRSDAPAVGGGSGYFGGGGSAHVQAGGGGSSYISGHNGCVAIEESSTENNITFPTKNGVACTDGTTDQDCSVHYSGREFTDTVMIDGKGYNWTTEVGDTVVGMPNYTGTGTMVGNTGDGYAKITLEDSILCKRATTLHTASCQNSLNNGKQCSSLGYAYGDIITYGNIPNSKNYKVGDAFDCDVNGDSNYSSTNERFYYVTDLAENDKYAILIYSNITVGGVKKSSNYPTRYYDSSGLNNNGPISIFTDLPNSTQWSNVRLFNNRRQIKSSNSSNSTSAGDLPIFKYTNNTSRLLTLSELTRAGVQTDFRNYEFLLEATSFDVMGNTWGFWLETPYYNSNNKAYHVDSDWAAVSAYDTNTAYIHVKPVIEVPKNRME